VSRKNLPSCLTIETPALRGGLGWQTPQATFGYATASDGPTPRISYCATTVLICAVPSARQLVTVPGNQYVFGRIQRQYSRKGKALSCKTGEYQESACCTVWAYGPERL
jgi:hypothetical protein